MKKLKTILCGAVAAGVIAVGIAPFIWTKQDAVIPTASGLITKDIRTDKRPAIMTPSSKGVTSRLAGIKYSGNGR